MLDRIIFGDNQFFGVNHASEEKARLQLMRFQEMDAVVETLRDAYEAGVPAFSCTTHERIIELAGIVRNNPADWAGMRFYPGMPYAHKYANAVTEHGYLGALSQLLPNSGRFDAMLRGGRGLLAGDVASLASLLIDAEMKPFEGLETPVVLLQNVLTDLLLGLGYHEAFRIFADTVRERYRAEAGFFTMNLPALLPALASVGLSNPIVCANVNKAGFRMSGGVGAYREATSRLPARVIAMSVLASGALEPREAIEWVVAERYVQSILFGASSRRNIRHTVELIRDADARHERGAA